MKATEYTPDPVLLAAKGRQAGQLYSVLLRV